MRDISRLQRRACAIGLVVATAVGCGRTDVDNRIAKLEEKVAKLTEAKTEPSTNPLSSDGSTSKSTPQDAAAFRVAMDRAVRELQDEVTSLRAEVNQLKEAPTADRTAQRPGSLTQANGKITQFQSLSGIRVQRIGTFGQHKYEYETVPGQFLLRAHGGVARELTVPATKVSAIRFPTFDIDGRDNGYKVEITYVDGDKEILRVSSAWVEVGTDRLALRLGMGDYTDDTEGGLWGASIVFK